MTGFHKQCPLVEPVRRWGHPNACPSPWGAGPVYRQGSYQEGASDHPVSRHRRESQTLSVRGESIPEEQFCQSLCRTLRMWPGARLIDYVCVESSLLGEFP